MARLLRWIGIALGAAMLVLVAAAAVAAVTDRPDDEPIALDPTDPAVTAYLDAEAALLDHHGVAFDEHVVEVADPPLSIRVLEVGAGTGTPVVVVPGDSGEAARLAPLLAELDGWRFLLVNRPGGGASDTVDHRAVDLRELAVATLDAVYDGFGLAEAPIVATSIGGAWAWWYALEHPDRVPATTQLGVPALVEGATMPGPMRLLGVPGVNRLLLPAISPGGPEDAVDVLRFLGHPEEVVEEAMPQFAELEYRARLLPTYRLAWRSVVEEVTGPFGRFDATYRLDADELGRLDAPTLLVWPTNDPFGDVAAGEHVAGLFADAELALVGVGHLPWLDEPAETAELVDAHLRAATDG